MRSGEGGQPPMHHSHRHWFGNPKSEPPLNGLQGHDFSTDMVLSRTLVFCLSEIEAERPWWWEFHAPDILGVVLFRLTVSGRSLEGYHVCIMWSALVRAGAQKLRDRSRQCGPQSNVQVNLIIKHADFNGCAVTTTSLPDLAVHIFTERHH